MVGNRVLRRAGTVVAIAAMQASLFAAVASGPAAARRNDFRLCADELVAAGIAPAAAADACGKALLPDELSLCVLGMVDGANIAADFALDNCFRVRRPDELATCVLEIDDALEPESPTTVVESCRKSLLPLRFADCVVGVGDREGLAATDALETCLAADKP